MKPSFLLATLLLSSSISAQTIDITTNWSLLGATENISNMQSFNADCISVVWAYDNSAWYSYVPNASSNNLSAIQKGKGFWVQGKKSCSSLDLNKTSSSSVSSASSSSSSKPALTSDFTPPTGKVTVSGETPADKRMLLATSTDGINFTRTNKVFSDQANVPDFVQDSSGRLYLYYTGWTVGTKTNTSAVAVSDDNGATWAYKYLNISGISFPHPGDPDVVILPDGTFRLYFTGTINNTLSQIHYAEGTDGINFTYKGVSYTNPNGKNAKDNFVFQKSDGTWATFVLFEENDYAESNDSGKTFAKVSSFNSSSTGGYLLESEIKNSDGSFTVYGFTLDPTKDSIVSFSTTDFKTFSKLGTILKSADTTTGLEYSYLKNVGVIKLKNGTYLLAYTTVIQ